MNKTQAKIQEVSHEVEELLEKVEIVLSEDNKLMEHFELLQATFRFSFENKLWDKALTATAEALDFLKEVDADIFTFDGITFRIGD